MKFTKHTISVVPDMWENIPARTDHGFWGSIQIGGKDWYGMFVRQTSHEIPWILIMFAAKNQRIYMNLHINHIIFLQRWVWKKKALASMRSLQILNSYPIHGSWIATPPWSEAQAAGLLQWHGGGAAFFVLGKAVAAVWRRKRSKHTEISMGWFRISDI